MHTQRGQILIESIVSISVGVVALLGFLQLLTQALRISNDVSQKSVATYLAAEGVEITKSLIDLNHTNNRPWNDYLQDGNYEFVYNTTPDINGLDDERIGTGLSSAPLQYHEDTGTYDYIPSGGITTGFTRTVQINPTGSTFGSTEEIEVISIVQWPEDNGAAEVRLEDHFFNWRL